MLPDDVLVSFLDKIEPEQIEQGAEIYARIEAAQFELGYLLVDILADINDELSRFAEYVHLRSRILYWLSDTWNANFSTLDKAERVCRYWPKEIREKHDLLELDFSTLEVCGDGTTPEGLSWAKKARQYGWGMTQVQQRKAGDKAYLLDGGRARAAWKRMLKNVPLEKIEDAQVILDNMEDFLDA